MNNNTMEHTEIIIGPRGDHHNSVWQNPNPSCRGVSVPEGGSTILFVLLAFTAIAWATMKRYRADSGEDVAAARVSR